MGEEAGGREGEEMSIALSTWFALVLLYTLYRFAFEYGRVPEDQPLMYRTTKGVLLWLHHFSFAFAFILAARNSALALLVASILCAWGFYILMDWWAFRRGLANRANRYLKVDPELTKETAWRYARLHLSRQIFGDEEWLTVKKLKKPWLAFVLVLLAVLPGFLYYRWKVAAGIAVALVPWSLLSSVRMREFIGIGRPFRYVVMLALAVLAFVDVSRMNDKRSVP
jgi:hypothetical protein